MSIGNRGAATNIQPIRNNANLERAFARMEALWSAEDGTLEAEASWLVTDGVPLEIVKELLGHSSITMTERYTHLALHRGKEAFSRMGGMPQSSHTIN